MKIYNTPTDKLDDIFNKVGEYIKENYENEMNDIAVRELGIAKEDLDGMTLNDILRMLMSKWNELE